MRVIALPTDAKKARAVFGILYTAAFGGEGAKDHATARALGKLQDALEAVSNNGGKPEEPRTLKDGVEEIRLEDAHHEILKERIFGAGIPWLAAASRRVTEAYDLMESATEVKP